MDSNTKDVLLIAIPLIAAGFSAWIALQNARLAKKLETVAKDMNGKLAELVTTKEKAAKSEGKEEERVENRERVAVAVSEAAKPPPSDKTG